MGLDIESSSVVGWFWTPAPTDAVQEFFGPAWSWFFNSVTHLGSVYAVVLVLALTLWLSGRSLSYGLIGVILIAVATNAVLWTLVGVPRPDDPDIVVRSHLSVSSFPSGHVMIATALWGGLAAFGKLPKSVAALIVFVVMVSRLYLGAHYLGDVLGGAVIGVLLVATYSRLKPGGMRLLSRLPFWSFLLAGLVIPFATLGFMGTTARGWELFGVALAVGVGMSLEYRYVRFAPIKVALRWQALKLATGLGVMVPLLLARGLLGSNQPLLDTTLMVLATVWGVLVAPALFSFWRLSRYTELYSKEHEA